MQTDNPVSNAEMRALLDKQAISEALYTYCRAVDRADHELGYSVWHDDAEADYGSIYKGTGRGAMGYICDSSLKGIVHSHQITNILIELDGDRALSEAYVTSAMRMMHDGQLMQINTRGRYLDRWTRQDGRWLIIRRVFAHDLDEIRAVTPGYITPTFTLDRDDPSYALFEGGHGKG